jgi:hypothetical protein
MTALREYIDQVLQTHPEAKYTPSRDAAYRRIYVVMDGSDTLGISLVSPTEAWKSAVGSIAGKAQVLRNRAPDALGSTCHHKNVLRHPRPLAGRPSRTWRSHASHPPRDAAWHQG